MRNKLAIAAALAALPAAYALAQSDSGMMHGEMMMNMKPGMHMSEADKGYMAAMHAMGQNMMGMQMTGDPSADFVRMMIPHHQSAIDMAKVLLQQEKADPEIKAIAEKIVADQTKEIEQLQAWLKTHDR
jgi:uncharacterized protein (DUF305 family)